MKYILLTLLTLCLNAQEFELIKPIAVEEAPTQTALKTEMKEIKIEKQKEAETIPKEKRLDSDSDGVFDSKDRCPDTSREFMVDEDGCPKTATLEVNFAPAKYDVSQDLINQLENFAEFLKQNKGYQVVIYGYTDSIGEEQYNKTLSQKRAEAVKKALESYGISSIRLTSIGRGEKDPIADNIYEDGRAKNRRIEVELIY
ncbi:MAG: OmpA family protein [Campylobacterota bacterium]|nr:OmpA family protein [Campylobacterota bacterium]